MCLCESCENFSQCILLQFSPDQNANQKKKKTDCKIIRNLRHSLSVSLTLSIPLSLSAAHAAKHELVNTTGRKNHIFHTRTQLTHTHHEVFVVSNLQQFSPHLPTTTTTTTARETTIKKGEKKILSRKKMKRKQENLPQFLSFPSRSLFSPHQSTLQISAILHAAQRARRT